MSRFANTRELLRSLRGPGPHRFRQCPDCRGAGEIDGQADWHSDARCNATDCRTCFGEGGDYFPLHGYDYDPLNDLAAARKAYLRDRYDTRPVALSATGIWPARCEDSARKYGALRQRIVSPEKLP